MALGIRKHFDGVLEALSVIRLTGSYNFRLECVKSVLSVVSIHLFLCLLGKCLMRLSVFTSDSSDFLDLLKLSCRSWHLWSQQGAYSSSDFRKVSRT